MGIVNVETAVAAGRLTDHGAQVLAWRPAGNAPVIWLSSQAVFAPGMAIRGGVPICFPWFGSGLSGDLSPAHGFARLVEWRPTSVSEVDGVTTVVHELTEADVTAPEFPYRYRAVATVEFGSTLTMSLRVENTDDGPLTFEAALHTYLHVGDATQIELLGLDGAGYHDKVLGSDAVQSGPVTIDGEVDRVYASSSAVEVHDPVLGRTLLVEKSGSDSTIVWNPWVQKAQAMSDFGDEEWREMVCVETANVGASAPTLGPGEAHVMQVSISCLRLR